MHWPGHSAGCVITATGVTPDIVLANFLIVYLNGTLILSSQVYFNKFSGIVIISTVAPGERRFRHRLNQGKFEGCTPMLRETDPQIYG